MSRHYKALLMDVDGTLLDFDRAEAAAFVKVLAKYGLEPEERYVQEYHRINQECWEAFEVGQMERDDVLTVRFERFFGAHNLPVSGREAEDAYRVWLGEGAYLMEGALEILDYLKERYELYVVTNGVGATQRKRLKASGLSGYFRELFISEEAGSQKPQKEFFDYCFARIPDIRPEEMMVIGDSLTSDIQGGVNAGVDTCWFNPQGNENRKALPVTREIRRLSELKTFL